MGLLDQVGLQEVHHQGVQDWGDHHLCRCLCYTRIWIIRRSSSTTRFTVIIWVVVILWSIVPKIVIGISAMLIRQGLIIRIITLIWIGVFQRRR